MGPLFGAVLAGALDRWWDELDRPDPFLVIEAGAASGALAEAVLRVEPACARALRYVLVERSPALRAAQADRLRLEPPPIALGPRKPTTNDDEPAGETAPVPMWGPLVTSLAELPAGPLTAVVVANELLDNLAFRLAERTSEGWAEVCVGERDGELAEVLIAAPPDFAATCARLAPAASLGSRIPIQEQAAAWVRAALELVDRGRVVAFDYASMTTAELAARPAPDWLRTYRSHGRGSHPLDGPGSQDVTCEIAVDQLPTANRTVRTQREFLDLHGIGALVERAASTWRERAVLGDLIALAARSRVGEADALLDPGGLGGFLVMEWTSGKPQ